MRAGNTGVDPRQRVGKPLRVASDERLTELGLAGEVVMQGSAGKSELSGDIRIAEAVEATLSHALLGGIENPSSRPGLPSRTCQCHR